MIKLTFIFKKIKKWFSGNSCEIHGDANVVIQNYLKDPTIDRELSSLLVKLREDSARHSVVEKKNKVEAMERIVENELIGYESF